MISIQIDDKQFADARKLLDKCPEEVAKAVTKNYAIKSAAVKNTLITKRSGNNRLRGEISSTGSPMSLKRFRVSRNAMGTDFSKLNSALGATKFYNKKEKEKSKRSPIKVQILKGRRLAPLSAGALFKTPKGKKLGLLRRVHRRSLPITTTAGPSVPQMFGAERTLEQLEPLAQETLKKRFIHEVEFRLGKKG